MEYSSEHCARVETFQSAKRTLIGRGGTWGIRWMNQHIPAKLPQFFDIVIKM